MLRINCVVLAQSAPRLREHLTCQVQARQCVHGADIVLWDLNQASRLTTGWPASRCPTSFIEHLAHPQIVKFM
jgi:hypothetical protein